MSMSTHVVLLRSPDDPTYQKYLRVLRACQDADVDPPADVDEYFGGYGVDNEPESPLVIRWEPRPWGNDYCQGFEVDLDTLPEGVKTIRFYNSW